MKKIRFMNECRVLVTAGSTWTRIDDVRIITNIFTGNTGINIARHFAEMGVDTTLLYNPKINRVAPFPGLVTKHYVTYDDLYATMQEEIENGNYDVVIHSAAVSDYGAEITLLADVETPVPSGVFQNGIRVFQTLDNRQGKISSTPPNMTISMSRTAKIVDLVKQWDPGVFLVKFKLEVGRSYEDLVAVATANMAASSADMMVANDLSGHKRGIPPAIIIGSEGLREVEKRKMLPMALFNTIQWDIRKRG